MNNVEEPEVDHNQKIPRHTPTYYTEMLGCCYLGTECSWFKSFPLNKQNVRCKGELHDNFGDIYRHLGHQTYECAI